MWIFGRKFGRSAENCGQKYSSVLYSDQKNFELNTIITRVSNIKKPYPPLKRVWEGGRFYCIVIYSLFLDKNQDKNTWGFSVKKKIFWSGIFWESGNLTFLFQKISMTPSHCLRRKSGTNARKHYTCLKMLSVFFSWQQKIIIFLQKTESRSQWV